LPVVGSVTAMLHTRLGSSTLGSLLPPAHEKPYDVASQPVTESSWLQPVSTMSMQQ
jgi:hypothetical protein